MITRKEFMEEFWKYYMVLEDDFIKLMRYVDLRKSNYKTCSDEIIKQLQAAASEFDNVCRHMGEYDDPKEINILGHKDYLKKSNKKLDSVKVKVKPARDITVRPFIEWAARGKQETLKWWKAYNNVKHTRSESYKEGNFEMLILAMAALYYCEMLYIKNICENTEEIDVPDNESKLFEIQNWDSRYPQGIPDSRTDTELRTKLDRLAAILEIIEADKKANKKGSGKASGSKSQNTRRGTGTRTKKN